VAERGACLVVGAGDGLGAAIARAFAAEGLDVCLTRRPRHLAELEKTAAAIRAAGGRAHAFGVDAREESDMAALVDKIEREIAPLEVVVFNIGANVRFGIVETTAQVYRKVFEMAANAGFLAGREAARVMTPRARGAILFTGATASLRGRAGFSAFASAKHALRALAQSMARELGPKGVHVAHVIVDGVIAGEFARGAIADYEQRLARDEILRPDDIAPNYVWLWKQKRSAWTHEMDLRPWSESW
jgi:NAD(P)-dependent dehydrogenase (short-subunit alcohol dehydrogenase family)